MTILAALLLSLLTYQVPSQSTGIGAWELGARVVSDVPGKITAVRFYKWPGDPGPHVGKVWSASHVQLAAVVFAGETASGWQEQALPTPVAVAAGDVFVVSVNTVSGFHYAIDADGFATPMVDGHLTFKSGAYTTIPGNYPLSDNGIGNYFRDVVFVADAVPTITIGPDQAGGFLAKLAGFAPGAYRLGVTMTDAAGAVVTSVLPITMSTPLESLPLLQPADLTYLGAFRLPHGAVGGSSFDYGGAGLTWNAAGKSLFVFGHVYQRYVAEVTAPAAAISTDINQIPTAFTLQAFADVTAGAMAAIDNGSGASVSPGGLFVSAGKLYASAYLYYDALRVQTLSHFVSDVSIGQHAKGPLELGAAGTIATGEHAAGFVSGYMARVPPAWQAALGGPALTGQCCLTIISRTSSGPAAFAFDPAQIGTVSPVPLVPLVYYPAEHPTIGDFGGQGTLYNGSTQMGGVVFPDGTRSVLFFGRRGMGTFCYGEGTSDPKLGGTEKSPGDYYCFDPANNAKGTHGYPYQYWVWAYDALDLAAVKAGKKQPWDVVPYTTWKLDLPFGSGYANISGVAYDPASGRIFLSADHGDGDYPLINVFSVTP